MGDLAVVVAMDTTLKGYATFTYPVTSEEFKHLTGVRAVQHPPERTYIGISPDAGREISGRLAGQNPEGFDLRSIDKLVVVSYFLDRNQEKPNKIILESIRGGYRVVEAN